MVDNYFSQVVIKFYTDAVYFISCTNVSIAKLVFEFCECSECNEDGPAIYVISCIFCNIEHVTLSHFMLRITNMMGKSYFHHINIHVLYQKVSCNVHIRISITYTDSLQISNTTTNQDTILVMNNFAITGKYEDNEEILHRSFAVVMAMYIVINIKFGVSVIVQNSVISDIISFTDPLLSIELHSPIYNFSKALFTNFTLKDNEYSLDLINRAAVDIRITDINTSISFIGFSFLSNFLFTSIIGFKGATTFLFYTSQLW